MKVKLASASEARVIVLLISSVQHKTLDKCFLKINKLYFLYKVVAL